VAGKKKDSKRDECFLQYRENHFPPSRNLIRAARPSASFLFPAAKKYFEASETERKKRANGQFITPARSPRDARNAESRGDSPDVRADARRSTSDPAVASLRDNDREIGSEIN